MRKSGWAVAAGLGSLVLLLSACGGSSGTTQASNSTSQSTSASQSASSSGTATSPATGTTSTKGQTSTTTTPSTHTTAGPQPSSAAADTSIPPIGTTVMVVRPSALGYVLAEASGYVVYTYAKDHKGGSPTCTGSCASVWAPLTGVPQVSSADSIPGTFGLVTGAGGVKQITYNGYPLYTYKLAGPLATTGNGIGGVWYVVKMSPSDVKS
jgi:predicted lipoprotein with Yx(FWY)xxD motif